MTFDDLCRLDARLRDLERDVREFADVYGRKEPRCANAAWYGYGPFQGRGFKPRLLKLVGDEREPLGYAAPQFPPHPDEFSIPIDHPYFDECNRLYQAAVDEAEERLTPEARDNERVLRSSSAYDVVYDHLYELLPDCSGCSCM